MASSGANCLLACGKIDTDHPAYIEIINKYAITTTIAYDTARRPEIKAATHIGISTIYIYYEKRFGAKRIISNQ